MAKAVTATAMSVAKPAGPTLEPSEAAPAASQQTGPSYTTTAPECYAEQLARKRKRVEELFSDFQLPQMEVFESEREHYRLRQAAARQLCRLSHAVAQLPASTRTQFLQKEADHSRLAPCKSVLEIFMWLPPHASLPAERSFVCGTRAASATTSCMKR